MIKQAIDHDIKSAMLAGDKPLAQALRTIKSVILNAEIAAGKREEGLDDQAVTALLQKEQKKRVEAAELYEKGGNAEQAAAERYEESVIQKYLPEQLSEAEVNDLIKQAISELDGPMAPAMMGKVISAVKEKSGGAADGALIARLVKAQL